jgi:hypothetical protein
VDYRTASLSETGAVLLELVNTNETTIPLHEIAFPPTGDWQNWTTTRARATLPSGQIRIRMNITAPLFNINWLEFTRATVTGVEPTLLPSQSLQVYPNPSNDRFTITATLITAQDAVIFISDLAGRRLRKASFNQTNSIELNITDLNPGMYIVTMQLEDGPSITKRIIVGN